MFTNRGWAWAVVHSLGIGLCPAAVASNPISKRPASAQACEQAVEYRSTIPMNFVYGTGKALDKRDGMRAKTTFEAILLGERTSTSRKNRSLDAIQVGDVLRFTRDSQAKTGEIFARVVAKRSLVGVSPDEWSELEGYDQEAVLSHWQSGKNFSEYRFQIIYEVIGYRADSKSEIVRRGFKRHRLLKKFKISP